MTRFLSLILTICPLIMISQSIFRSTNESSSLLQFRESGSIQQPLLNTAVFQLGDTPIGYDFMHSSNKGYFLGIKTAAKSNSSVANIFKNSDFVLGYKGNLSLGKVFYLNPDTLKQSKIDSVEFMIDTLRVSNERKKKEILAIKESIVEKSDNIKKIRSVNSEKKDDLDSLEKDVISNLSLIKNLIKDTVKIKQKIDSLHKYVDENTEVFDGIVLYGTVGLEGRGFYNYIRGQSIDNEIISQSNTLPKYTLGINYFNKNVKKMGAVVLGVGLNIEKSDNFKDLKEVSITNMIKSKSPIDTTFSREIEQTFTGFEGEYKDNIRKTSLVLDLYLVPNFLTRKIGFALNYQFNSLKDKADTEDVNIGLYFIEKKDVFNPSFAINFKFSDVGHKEILAEGKSRFSISVTKQFNLVKSK